MTVRCDSALSSGQPAGGGARVWIVGRPRLVAEALAEVVERRSGADVGVCSSNEDLAALRSRLGERDVVIFVDGELPGLELASTLRATSGVAIGVVADRDTPAGEYVIVTGESSLDELLDFVSAARGETRSERPTLSKRQAEVLELIAHGLPGATVAEMLGIAPKTVSNHISGAYRRLRARNQAHAALIAAEAGLIKFDPVALSNRNRSTR